MEKGVILVEVFFMSFLMFSIPFCYSMQLNLTYDDNGNLITGDGKYREYNEFNQLIRIYEGDSDEGDILETYVYHPTEDRVLIKYENYGGFNDPKGAVVYVNDNFVRAYTNLKGMPKVNDTYYVMDENGNLIAEYVVNSSEKLYYHNDHLGSTSVITNSSGDIVEETFYEPYGDILEGGEVGVE